MAGKRPGKRPPAQALQNVVPIHKLPRRIKRLSDAHAIAWILEATQLTIHEALTCPRRLVREQLLAALKRERREARLRRSPT